MKCCWCELGEQDCRLQISRNCNIKHYVVQGYNENDGRIISSRSSAQKDVETSYLYCITYRKGESIIII